MRKVQRPSWSRPTIRRHGYAHQKIAKLVTSRARACAMAYLGNCRGPLEADHIIPVVWGGGTELSNYQALCRYHNRSKGAKVR